MAEIVEIVEICYDGGVVLLISSWIVGEMAHSENCVLPLFPVFPLGCRGCILRHNTHTNSTIYTFST